MDGRRIGYWVATGIIAVVMTGGGVLDAMQTEDALEIFGRLGYPPYFATMLGVAKLLGVAAILAPRTPRLKEWAYAGFTFDLVAAAWSHVASGDAFGFAVFPAALLVPLAASYLLRPPSRRL